MIRTLACVLTAFVTVQLGVVAAGTVQSLAFETECLDLDLGTVGECRAAQPEPGWDLLVSYHADRTTHAVVIQHTSNAVEIARLAGAVFEEVTAADIETAPFTRAVSDHPFDASAVLLIRTDTGAVYKLGNPSEDEPGLVFEYGLLSPAP